MQNSSDKSQHVQDDKTNGVEDSLMMTIEYLRARLLSERSISKATKERADELATRVKELEEQLKVVSLQRKRAEKAARDVYSYLDSLGVSEVSGAYESGSDEDDSQCESNMYNGETLKDDQAFGSLDVRKNGDEQSGSEPESIPSSGWSLSWKGRKNSTRNLEKKSICSPVRSRTGFALVNSSPRHRLGRSCRQIKKREPRSTIYESRHESCKPEAESDNAVNGLDCLDFQNEDFNRSPKGCTGRGSEKEKLFHSFQAQECDASSSTHERECNGEIERALEHQAQLIRSYEDQEKAQRDWEEKYADNNDSCEPGSHSDVTEDRDENKAAVSHPVGVNPCHDDQESGTKTKFLARNPSMTHYNSFKVSPDANTGSSEKHNVTREMLPATFPAPDFAFTELNNSNLSWNQAATHSIQHKDHVDPPKNANGPHKEPARLETVLDALQEAKLLIKRQMKSSTETSNRDVELLKLPVGCCGLFRVPNDPVAPSQVKCLISDYSSEKSSPSVYGKALAVQGHHYVSSPSSDPFSTRDISSRHPTYDFHFDTNISGSSNSNSNLSYPDFFPGTSSDQMIDRPFPGVNTGIPPTRYPWFQNYDVRSNMYR